MPDTSAWSVIIYLGPLVFSIKGFSNAACLAASMNVLGRHLAHVMALLLIPRCLIPEFLSLSAVQFAVRSGIRSIVAMLSSARGTRRWTRWRRRRIVLVVGSLLRGSLLGSARHACAC